MTKNDYLITYNRCEKSYYSYPKRIKIAISCSNAESAWKLVKKTEKDSNVELVNIKKL